MVDSADNICYSTHRTKTVFFIRLGSKNEIKIAGIERRKNYVDAWCFERKFIGSLDVGSV